jgi:hypothetical protein
VRWFTVSAGALAALSLLALLLGALGAVDGWIAAASAIILAMTGLTTAMAAALTANRRELAQVRRTVRRLNRRVESTHAVVAHSTASSETRLAAAAAGSDRIRALGAGASFFYKFEEHLRIVDRLSDECGVVHPLWDIEDKLKGYCFADRHGIDRPVVYGIYDGIEAVPWQSLPDHFVLKPRHGASNRGVLALQRVDDATYWDVMLKRSWTIAEIVESVAGMRETGRVSSTVFAEELLRDPHRDGHMPMDWKLMCFEGSVGLVLQKDLRDSAIPADWRFKFWDREFTSLGPIKYPDRHDPHLSPPADPKGLVAVAERAAALTGLPLVRIDLFESHRGVVLGEFSPLPGHAQVFTSTADADLGDLWERAEVAALAQQIRAGAWDHLRSSDHEVSQLVARDGASAGLRVVPAVGT